MRGRPARELLRQSAPLIAVLATLVVAPAAAAASPQPDKAPSVAPALAPDPVPGTSAPTTSAPTTSSQQPVSPVTTPARPPAAYVAPAHTSPKTVTHAKVKQAVVRPRHRAVAARPTRFVLPRVALPVLFTAAAVKRHLVTSTRSSPELHCCSPRSRRARARGSSPSGAERRGRREARRARARAGARGRRRAVGGRRRFADQLLHLGNTGRQRLVHERGHRAHQCRQLRDELRLSGCEDVQHE